MNDKKRKSVDAEVVVSKHQKGEQKQQKGEDEVDRAEVKEGMDVTAPISGVSEAQLTAFYDYVDAHQDAYIARLTKAVAIPSVSADPARRSDCLSMISFYRSWMDKLGIENETRPLGTQDIGGKTLEIPPALIGTLGTDTTKPTVGLYGHLDVQPAVKSDGWNTEPFTLTRVKDAGIGKDALYGRGSSDDKGPALGWLWAIEALAALKIPLPVNLRFCVESMEESGSLGFEKFFKKEVAKSGYLSTVDAWCISDNYWLGVKRPCVQYGLRGIVYFFVEIKGSTKDLHSGKFGGTVREPMNDVVAVLGSLTDPKTGRIIIPGVNESVRPLSEQELDQYKEVDFSADEFAAAAGVQSKEKLKHQTNEDLLMGMWRNPNLSIHGIEGGFSGAGAKTVIPSTVIGKFSIRLVPDMDPDEITKLTVDHVNKVFHRIGSTNQIRVWNEHGTKPFVSDPNSPNFMAARRATKRVYGVEPDLSRSGGSIGVVLPFQETGKSVLLLPMGRADDGAHSQNEKLDVSNYIQGIKLLGTYLLECATLPR